MPAAPATQPNPNMGTRRMLRHRPILLTSRASIDGLQIPVTEVKKKAPKSCGRKPALAAALATAFSPSSVAVRIQCRLASPQLFIVRYSLLGMER